MQCIYRYRILVLMIVSLIYLISKFGYFIAIHFNSLKYKELSKDDFPEYGVEMFPFQKNLVLFLNNEAEVRNHIYWLDGSWGSGKTHFIRTFFQDQFLKRNELYYISCFGIKTREQAEAILVREIENRSTFGNLDFIPGVGGLFKWFYKTIGFSLMKKNSVIIFDDLERVSYIEEENKDNPDDYNDLLGYIDFLADYKNYKVIVILNSEKISYTREKLIKNKFRLGWNSFFSSEEMVNKLITTSNMDDEAIKQFVALIYKFQLVFEPINLRSIRKTIEEMYNLNKPNEKLSFMLKYLNGNNYLGNYNPLHSVLFTINDEYDNDGQRDQHPVRKYPYYEILVNSHRFQEAFEFWNDEGRQEDFEKFKCRLDYYNRLMASLWKIGKEIPQLRSLIWYYIPQNKDLDHKTSFYSCNSNSDIQLFLTQQLLVEIYYNIKNDDLKDNYSLKNTTDLKDYKWFIEKKFKDLPVKINGKSIENYL